MMDIRFKGMEYNCLAMGHQIKNVNTHELYELGERQTSSLRSVCFDSIMSSKGVIPDFQANLCGKIPYLGRIV